MGQVLDYLQVHSLAVTLLGLGALLGICLIVEQWRRKTWSATLLLSSASLGLLGLGGLLLGASSWVPWAASAAAACLFLMLAVVVLTGNWWAPLGYTVGAVLLLGLGGMSAEPGARGLNATSKMLLSLQPLQPWWLLVLLLVPIIIWLSFRSLAGLGRVRRWVAIGLRCLLIALLALALAETEARQPNDSLTVLFLWDRSLSIPQDFENGRDRREERIKNFINSSVAERGPGHEHDRAGLIVFGRWPRLELPPSDAPQFRLRKIASTVDDTHTDIAAAIKLASRRSRKARANVLSSSATAMRTWARRRNRRAWPGKTACKSTWSRYPPADAMSTRSWSSALRRRR